MHALRPSCVFVYNKNSFITSARRSCSSKLFHISFFILDSIDEYNVFRFLTIEKEFFCHSFLTVNDRFCICLFINNHAITNQRYFFLY
jgi:hypothetical protein